MAKTIPQLTDATTVNAADELIIQQGGITKRATGAELAKGLNTINGTVNVKDFGAVGDGAADDTAAIKAACDHAIATGKSAYVPSGVYKCTFNVLLFDFATSATKTFSLYGDGASSILKMGDGLMTASFRRFVDLRPAIDMDLIEVRDLVLDNNAIGSAPPPTSFAYEQSHTLRFSGEAGTTTKLLRYHNVVIKDPVADGMNNQGTGAILNWVISNCSEIDRTRVRRSIQCSRLPENLVVTGFTVSSPVNFGGIEAEPVDVPTTKKTIQLSNCNVPILDLAAGEIRSPLVVWNIDNCVATHQATLSAAIYRVSNSTLKIANRWAEPHGDSSATNCRFLLNYDDSTGAVTGVDVRGVNRSLDQRLGGFNFYDCQFDIDYDGPLPVAATGYCLFASSAIPAADVPYQITTATNCRFDSRAAGSVDCYRNGTWILRNNIYGCATLADQAGAVRWHLTATPDYSSSVWIDGGDFRQCIGHALVVSSVGSGGGRADSPTFLTGEWLGAAASSITPFSTSGSIANNAYIYNSRRITATALPTMGIRGDIVALSASDRGVGSVTEYVATVTSLSAPAFRLLGQRGANKNTTANRPTPSAEDVGLVYFDTTLNANGRPIWWNGAAWIDFGPIAGSATYDPPNLIDGAGATTTVTVTGAALGDYAEASFSLDLQGITVTAWVSAADTVSVRFQNETGGTIDLGSGTLRARVFKP